MKKFWQFIYYILVYPGIVIAAHILSIPLIKVRRGLFPKYRTVSRLKAWVQKNPNKGRRILFHTASLGEFEHIRPILMALKKNYQTTNIVTFFSPSGYDNVKGTEGLDFYLYIPFDWPVNWSKLYELLDPSLIIIAKHDVWPGQIWTAKQKNIPAYLINASLSAKSSRTGFGIKTFLKHVYHDFYGICAISDDDARRFNHHYPRCQVTVTGDTKYDQVVIRREMAKSQHLFPDKWLNKYWIFVAGSIWPEDETHLFPALEMFLKNEKQIRIILVPHQPERKTVDRLRTHFAQWRVAAFSLRQQLTDERILIVDAVGYLAGLYHHAQLAYVGGSFHQGIHNVMEPAVFGIPVLYGPMHENSYEAVQLAKGNGGFVVKDQTDIYRQITRFYKDNETRKHQGRLAETYATRNTGATDRLIKSWQSYLKE